jgi:hypothetical protein
MSIRTLKVKVYSHQTYESGAVTVYFQEDLEAYETPQLFGLQLVMKDVFEANEKFPIGKSFYVSIGGEERRIDFDIIDGGLQ